MLSIASAIITSSSTCFIKNLSPWVADTLKVLITSENGTLWPKLSSNFCPNAFNYSNGGKMAAFLIWLWYWLSPINGIPFFVTLCVRNKFVSLSYTSIPSILSLPLYFFKIPRCYISCLMILRSPLLNADTAPSFVNLPARPAICFISSPLKIFLLYLPPSFVDFVKF